MASDLKLAKLAIVATSLFLVSACGVQPPTKFVDGGSTDDDNGAVFVALQKDFEGFNQWNHFDLGSDQSDGLPSTGVRDVYINKLPPHPSSSFPVGTIIVKTVGAGTPDAGPTFAMAKRGGGFNSSGATDWEWFELTTAANGQVQIMWRGTQPGTSDNYGNTNPNSCNQCHANYSTNDFVPSPQLELSSF
jgi:hypothetical protein